MARAVIIQYPGSNREHDLKRAVERAMAVDILWHADALPDAPDAVFLPGGFSWGDQMGAGLQARMRVRSPATDWVHAQSKRGTPIIGICNGFQILCHMGILPGMLARNEKGKFICRPVRLELLPSKSYDPPAHLPRSVLWPIAHGEGRYVTTDAIQERLRDDGRVVLKYQEEVNGSVADIAGICSDNGRVVGMMPHPENAGDRAVDVEGRRPADAFFHHLLTSAFS
ncbi:MAG: phosphoribosylformylglycinamidine synthase I [Alphaproteobacteria bacterium]|nr:phosphoribosylformylglycinamidine synthase I [Alphaproteobacteria bacterium]